MKNNDKNIRRSKTAGNAPMTPEQLLKFGFHLAYWRGLRGVRAEEAAAEFAYSAHEAAAAVTHGENIQAYQTRAGRWAMNNFLKYHNRRRKRDELYVRSKFGDDGQDGGDIRDPLSPDPLQTLIRKEDDKKLLERLRVLLSKREYAVVKGFILDGRK